MALVALGCRVSHADVDALAEELQERFDVARAGERAALVVVNTCALTADAEASARQAIRRAARDHPGARIVATGCCAELRPQALAALPSVAAVVGARSLESVAALVARLAPAPPARWPEVRDGGGAAPAPAPGPCTPGAPDGLAPAWASHARPFLKLQDGCDRRCAYCVVPAARGPSRSLAPEEALRRLARLGERHAEVVLTGVDLGDYGSDLSPPTSLEALVAEAVRRKLVQRLRLSSIDPARLPLGLLRDPRTRSALCEHLHLPLQSGSARVLRAMRRAGGARAFRRAIEEAAALAPGACFGTDVMVGFPGESDADHRATVSLVASLPLAYLHVFPFSPRPGTAAASLPGALPACVVKERVRELRALSARMWCAFLDAQVGRELEVVAERVEWGFARGTAGRYVPVHWQSSDARRGGMARVRISAVDAGQCLGVRA